MGQAEVTELRRTPLLQAHRDAGAKLVPFAGWEMPVQYEGVKAEHQAVRNAAGIFDVSHMGEIETTGPRAFEFLQAHLTNDLSKVGEGGAQYAMLCRADGGVIDDLITYRLAGTENGERFLSVVNAANREADYRWLQEQAESWDGVEVSDVSDDYAMIALQGPQAFSILRPLWSNGEPDRLGRFKATRAQAANVDVLACRTGYTGEDGVEFLLAPGDAEQLWGALVEVGARPIGLAARDTLRLEVCYPLYGNELTLERTPIEAGLKWCCALDKDFVGVEVLRSVYKEGPKESLVAFKLDQRAVPRTGCGVLHEGERVGVVTSGTFSPSLGIGAGMAYVSSELAKPGTAIDIDIRGKVRPAHVVPKPLYMKE